MADNDRNWRQGRRANSDWDQNDNYNDYENMNDRESRRGTQRQNRGQGSQNAGYNDQWQSQNYDGREYGSRGEQNRSQYGDQSNYGNQGNYDNDRNSGYTQRTGNYNDQNREWDRTNRNFDNFNDSDQYSQRGQYGSQPGYGQADNRQSQYGGSSYGNRQWDETNRQQSQYSGRQQRSGEAGRLGNDMGPTMNQGSYWDTNYQSEDNNFRNTSHRGKGPKGYTRSDERIREDLSDRFSDDDRLDASNIEVQVTNSEVILTGTVDSRQAKRHAEDLAERISGIRNVENRLRVQQEDSSTSSELNRNKSKETNTGAEQNSNTNSNTERKTSKS